MAEAKKKREVPTKPLHFYLRPSVRAAVDRLAEKRGAETGDYSLTGWFLALMYREAKAAGIRIAPAAEKKKA